MGLLCRPGCFKLSKLEKTVVGVLWSIVNWEKEKQDAPESQLLRQTSEIAGRGGCSVRLCTVREPLPFSRFVECFPVLASPRAVHLGTLWTLARRCKPPHAFHAVDLGRPLKVQQPQNAWTSGLAVSACMELPFCWPEQLHSGEMTASNSCPLAASTPLLAPKRA